MAGQRLIPRAINKIVGIQGRMPPIWVKKGRIPCQMRTFWGNGKLTINQETTVCSL